MTWCFNTLMGLKGDRLSWWIAPVPMPVYSFKALGFYWITYIVLCAAIHLFILFMARRKSGKRQPDQGLSDLENLYSVHSSSKNASAMPFNPQRDISDFSPIPISSLL